MVRPRSRAHLAQKQVEVPAFDPFANVAQEETLNIQTPQELIQGLQGLEVPSEQVRLTDPVTQEERLITEADAAANEQQQKRLKGIGLAAVDVTTQDAAVIRDSINQRIKDNEATIKDTKETNKIHETSVGDVLDISEDARSTYQWVTQPDNVVTFQEPEGEVDVPYSALVDESLPGVSPAQQAMAMNVSVATTMMDPAYVYMGVKSKQFSEVDTKQKHFTLAELEEDTSPAYTGQTLGEVKQAILSTKPSDYALIDAQAAAIGRTMQETAQINPTDTVNDTVVGEVALQRELDKGNIAVMSLTEPGSHHKQYFLAPTEQGKMSYEKYRGVSSTLLPGRTQKKLGPTVPIQFGESVYQSQEDLKRALENGSLGDQQAINVLNRTGYVTEEYSLAVVKRMTQLLEDNHPLALKYIKINDKEYQESYRKALRKALADPRIRTQKEAEQRAAEEAQDIIANKAIEARRNIEQAEKDIGTVSYPDYIFGNNHRLVNQARNNNLENKDILRAVKGFAIKASVKRYNPEDVRVWERYALQLQGILFDKQGRSRGQKSLDDFRALPQETRDNMGHIAMYAKHHISLYGSVGEDGTYISRLDKGKERPVKVRRMTPANLLDYYAQNHVAIMKDLGIFAVNMDRFINGDQQLIDALGIENPTDRDIAALKNGLERGELPWMATTAFDIKEDLTPEVGTAGRGVFTGHTRTEIDQNNSNLGIQTLMTGDKTGASILGISIDPQDPEAWYWDYNSFYNKLGDEIVNRSVMDTISDPDDKEAFLKFFNETSIVTDPKNQTRAIVVEGAYGLHPIVNQEAVDKIGIIYREPYNNLIQAIGSKEKTDAMMKAIRGDAFNNVIAKITVDSVVKALGSVLALNGDWAPSIRTAIGGKVDFSVGEVTPEYLDGIAFDETTGGMLTKARPAMYKIQSTGESIPQTYRMRRSDYDKQRTILDNEGKAHDAYKEYGIAMSQGVSATLTHSQDASLMKLTALITGIDKPQGIALGPLHDATVLNAKSYIETWIAYNQIAIPSLAKSNTVYTQLVDIANEGYQKLKAKAKEAKTANRKINVGESSDHRAIFGILDYHHKFSVQEEVFVMTDKSRQYYKEKQERVDRILEDAKRAGYIPPESGPRGTVEVSPENFMKLIDAVYQIQGVHRHPKDRHHTSTVEYKVRKWNKDRQDILKAFERGLFVSNNLN